MARRQDKFCLVKIDVPLQISRIGIGRPSGADRGLFAVWKKEGGPAVTMASADAEMALLIVIGEPISEDQTSAISQRVVEGKTFLFPVFMGGGITISDLLSGFCSTSRRSE